MLGHGGCLRKKKKCVSAKKTIFTITLGFNKSGRFGGKVMRLFFPWSLEGWNALKQRRIKHCLFGLFFLC